MGQRLGQQRLPPRPRVQLPRRREQLHRLLYRLPVPLALLPGVQRPLGLGPGGAAALGRPAPLVPAPGVPRRGRLHRLGVGQRHPRLLFEPAQPGAATAQGVPVVQLVGHRRPALRLPLRVEPGHPLVQAGAGIPRHLLQRG